jgi:16S rRNA (cytosine1402-N4)-methyltransferase
MSQIHIPVLLEEVINGLNISVGKIYIDATVGQSGHTKEIVRKGGKVLGIDRDPETIEALRNRKEEFEGKAIFVAGSFANIEEIAQENGFGNVSGILFDLGYSSWQLDKSGRGFSFSRNEPLDMRFDQKTQEIQASDVVNRMSKEELTELISIYAEEEFSEKIVGALSKARPIYTTGELVKALESAIPGYDNIRHFARIFQALRIAVNNELGALKKALPQAISLVEKGGRVEIISFHSLEDRIVKQFFKDRQDIKIITKKPITASREEMKKNSRSRSAKLRIAEKI